MINCQLREWSKSKKASNLITASHNQYFGHQVPLENKVLARHSIRSMSRTELSQQRLIRKETKTHQNYQSQKTLAAKKEEKTANKFKSENYRTKELVKFSDFISEKTKSRKTSCQYITNCKSKQKCKTPTYETCISNFSALKQRVHFQYFCTDSNQVVQQNPIKQNLVKNKAKSKISGFQYHPGIHIKSSQQGKVEIPQVKRMTIQQLEKLESDLAKSRTPSLSSVILNGKELLRVSNYSVQDNQVRNQRLYKTEKEQSTNPPGLYDQEVFDVDIMQTKIFKNKANQLKNVDKRPGSIYSKANLLSRLRTSSNTIQQKIQLHCQTIRLFSEMCQVKDPTGQFNLISQPLILFLVCKYYLELQKIEATIKGLTNCFTLKQITLNSQDISSFINSWNGKQFQHTLFLQSREALIKVRKGLVPFCGNEKFNEKQLLSSFSNTLLMQQLRHQCQLAFQQAEIFTLQLYQKIGWIMFAAFLTQQLRNPQSRCFTESALTHKQYEFVQRNNELFQSIIY